jgi:hypothetical protein
MGEATIEVRAEHLEPLRDAVLYELATNADWVKSAEEEIEHHRITAAVAVKEAARRNELEPARLRWDDPLEDVRQSVQCLAEVMELAEQLFTATGAETTTIHGDTAALAHLTESLANKVLAPRVSEAVNVSPLDAGEIEKIQALTDALGWATHEAVRLHDLAAVEIRITKQVAA